MDRVSPNKGGFRLTPGCNWVTICQWLEVGGGGRARSRTSWGLRGPVWRQARDTRHAEERKNQRQITLPEVLEVTRNGYREKAKDEYKPEWEAWNYAIRGRTLDGRGLRIAVSFDEEGFLLFITSIDLGE